VSSPDDVGGEAVDTFADVADAIPTNAHMAKVYLLVTFI